MVQILLTHLAIVFYLVLAYCFFNQWLDFILNDEEMASQQRFLSSWFLVIATVLWPIVVPFAYLELLKFHKKHKRIINLLMNSSANSSTDDMKILDALKSD